MTPLASTERGTETRRRIVEAATALFVEHGFAATSMNDLIRAAGVTKGGFYFHFASKVELAVEVITAIREAQHQDVVGAVSGHPRAVEQLAALARAAADSHRTPSGAAMCRLCMEIAGEPDAPALNPFDDWFQTASAMFRAAQAEGDMDPGIDPDAAGRYAVSAFMGFQHVAEVRREPLGYEEVEEYLAFAFRACGIRVPLPPPTPRTPNERDPS